MLRGREVSAREVIGAPTEWIEAVDPFVNAVVARCFEQAWRRRRPRRRGRGTGGLCGGGEVFRTWRALRFATAFGSLLRAPPATSART